MKRSASAHEIDDLDLVPLDYPRGVVGRAFDHHDVALDGDPARVDLEPDEKIRDRERAGDGERFSVQRNGQSLPQKAVAGERRRDGERLDQFPQRAIAVIAQMGRYLDARRSLFDRARHRPQIVIHHRLD